MNLDFLKGKKVLITGGAGLLGTSLTQHLVTNGVLTKSTYFSRKPPKHLEEHYQQYDFTKYQDCVDATANQDYIIICAVQASGVYGIRKSPTASIQPNLNIHTGLFEACVQNNVSKVVWVSSSTIYQEAFYPIREDQLDLNQPPYELYQGVGWVYRYLEQLGRCYYDKYGLQVGIIRTTNIYGPYDRFDDVRSHVIPALIKRALNKENPFIIWGNPNTIRDFIYVDDLMYGVLQIMEKYCIGDPINFSSGIPINIQTLVEIIQDVCNHRVPFECDQSKPSAVPYRVLDNTKFEALFNRFQKTSLKDGVKQTMEWYTSSLSRD